MLDVLSASGGYVKADKKTAEKQDDTAFWSVLRCGTMRAMLKS
jgi:hypothetical protein